MQLQKHIDKAKRSPIVGVMGSHAHAHAERSQQVGDWIARQGYHLLTGGGNGVMKTVTKAFVQVPGRCGMALAVVPAFTDLACPVPLPGYPNRWVEIPIYTHLGRGGPIGDEPTSRNHLNVLTSTVIILLPGGPGTASEARLTLRYDKPCVAYLRSAKEIPGLPDEIPVESDFAHVAAFVTRHTKKAIPIFPPA